MPVRPLPAKPSLAHLKCQARDLLRELAAHDAGAAQRIREFHPKFADAMDAEIFHAPLRLSDAQLAIARESGFPSWARLKRHIEKPILSGQLHLRHHERIEDAVFQRGVKLLDAGDAAELRLHLKRHPDLVRRRIVFEGGNYFRNPTLLEFVAENPIRHGKLPAHIVEVAKVILDAGAERSAIDETLGLVVTGSVVRECGVQAALIDLLCDYGANPSLAMHAALHGGKEAVEALLRRGAQVDLPVAAALGNMDVVQRMLPGAAPRERHKAFALAAQFGQVAIVRMLLDMGEDPNRFNPVGCHSHSTPLHQAAAAGHLEAVRLLVERGARMDIKDILWHGTPAGWAKHEGRKEVEEFLLVQERNGKRSGN
jgi:ankyrin repeat protein